MEQEELDPRQSLTIIARMVRETRDTLQEKSFYLILWGWVTIAANIGEYLIWEYTDYTHPYVIWLITIPAWVISMFYGKNNSSSRGVTTYSSKLILWIWVAFSINLLIIIFTGYFYHQISAQILMQAGLCTFITGLVIRYKPLIIGGSLFWIFTVIALLVSAQNALIVSAVAIFLGYLIPGYLLRRHKE